MSQPYSLPHQSGEERVRVALEALVAEVNPATTDSKVFRRARYDRGLAWVHFPEGFGGLGVRPELNRRVERELRAKGAPAPDPAMFFLQLAGPAIVTHGTDEQKRRFLRPMFSGEERWCQLFSEPGAGSDLAALSCRAVEHGGEWIINGHKVWNTLAHLADWGILLARSNIDVAKHEGITYFLLNLHSPGVEIRPLRQLTGEAEFNEVYLTDVRVPDEHRLGERGAGWRVAMTTLMNERIAIASAGGGRGSSEVVKAGTANEAVRLWKELPAEERTSARQDVLMRLWCRGEVQRLTVMRASQAAAAGNPGPAGSVIKLATAGLNKAVFDFCVTLLGASGQVGFDYTFRRPDRRLELTGISQGVRHAFLRVRANSIEGGSDEIQRNIVGEKILGLPPEERRDKNVPWTNVPR